VPEDLPPPDEDENDAPDDSAVAAEDGFTIEILPAEAGVRLDKVLADRRPDFSRARLQDLIRDGHVSLGDRAVTKPRHPLATGDRVTVFVPPPVPAAAAPQEIPLTVLFEDEHLIVINKAAGIVVHPAAGNADGTLVNALLHHCRGQLSGIGGVERPGIVHRLDKETSGCLVAAKTDAAHRELARQFADRETEKTYLCVVHGVPTAPAEGRIENRIGRHPGNRQKMTIRPEPHGKDAVTGYRIERADPAGAWALIRCDLFTGRTHQIRVHMKESLQCPILGDEIYAQINRQTVQTGRLMLHAWRLAFTHPVTGKRMAMESNIPPAFERFL
jgi:23S rRNA pseudouridine1911/1915/1917 synthase